MSLKWHIGKYHDVLITTKQDPVWAHKCILYRIPEFDKNFEANQNEKIAEYDMSKYSFNAVSKFIDSVYDTLLEDNTEPPSGNLKNIKDAADLVSIFFKFKCEYLPFESLEIHHFFEIFREIDDQMKGDILYFISMNKMKNISTNSIVKICNYYKIEAFLLSNLMELYEIHPSKIKLNFELEKEIWSLKKMYCGTDKNMLVWAWNNDYEIYFFEDSCESVKKSYIINNPEYLSGTFSKKFMRECGKLFSYIKKSR